VVVIDAQMHEPPMAFEWADADPRGGSNSWRRSPSPTCARAGWTARVSHPTVGLEWGSARPPGCPTASPSRLALSSPRRTARWRRRSGGLGAHLLDRQPARPRAARFGGPWRDPV